MRESIAVADSKPRLLLVGPARLLHVEIESDQRKGKVNVFRAPRRRGTSEDCEVAPDAAKDALARGGASLDISKDEVVCAKVDAVRIDHRARLSFHALSSPEAKQDAPPLREASLIH